MTDQSLLAAQTALSKHYGGAAKRIERQIFLCAVSEKQKCCGRSEGEASWILEDNEMMNKGLQNLNGEPYKRYRIFQRAI